MKTQRTKAVGKRWGFFFPIACVLLTAASGVYAQKGIGDPTGVVRQGLRPTPRMLSGKLISAETHPCEKTTGPSPAGTHLIVAGDDGREYNLHLGPADAVAAIVDTLERGTRVAARVFRTSNMPEDQYVVTTLMPGGHEVIPLRDANLRPLWAIQSRLDRGRGRGGAYAPGRAGCRLRLRGVPGAGGLSPRAMWTPNRPKCPQLRCLQPSPACEIMPCFAACHGRLPGAAPHGGVPRLEPRLRTGGSFFVTSLQRTRLPYRKQRLWTGGFSMIQTMERAVRT